MNQTLYFFVIFKVHLKVFSFLVLQIYSVVHTQSKPFSGVRRYALTSVAVVMYLIPQCDFYGVFYSRIYVNHQRTQRIEGQHS